MMWIRESFLSSTESFEKTVIHGHTVTQSRHCEEARHRIGIDTGAYATERLSAVQIHPSGSSDFIETNAEQSHAVLLVEPVIMPASCKDHLSPSSFAFPSSGRYYFVARVANEHGFTLA